MKQPAVLVVEDESAIADTILYALRTEGMQVETCTLGSEALDRVRSRRPDLVILDVGLPDISGFEVCRSMRTFSDVPVIFLTARHEEIDRIVGLEIGADDYVVKPFSPRELAA
ncbi:MAG TPA: two-component system response regulator CreB, partial [Cupriavidus sp.]|nr:two-component system response regulator CreB [Cupriavidus sp.]